MCGNGSWHIYGMRSVLPPGTGCDKYILQLLPYCPPLPRKRCSNLPQKKMFQSSEACTVFCDGSWGTFGAGAAAVLVAPSKVRICYAVKLDFNYTNNIAEYEALLLGFRKLKAMGIRSAILKTDSQVISGHVDKCSKARDPKLEKYLDAVQRLEASFEGFSVKNYSKGGK
jgi:ribonuclease HI